MTRDELTQRIRELWAAIQSRMDAAPNARDYYPDMDAFRAASDAYHAETERMNGAMQQLGEERARLGGTK